MPHESRKQKTAGRTDLADQEGLFRRTFENASVGIAHVNNHGHFIRINKKFSEITGYSQEELLKKTFQEITHPDDLEEDLKQFEALYHGEIDSYSMEKRYFRKDGSIVWINLTASIITGPKGDYDFYIAFIKDISIRKQAEEALQKSEQLFKLAAASAKIGAYSRNLQTGEDYWSPEALAIYGLMPGDKPPMKDSIPAAVHPDDRDAVIDLVQSLFTRTSTPEFSSEHRIVLPDGKIRWVNVKGRVEFDEKNKPVQTQGIIMDITRHKQVEEALRENEEKFRLIANNISQLAWMGDSEGNIYWMNKRWIDYTGQSPGENDGLRWKKLIHPDHLERVTKRLIHSWKNRIVWEDLFPLKDKNEQYHWFLSRAIPVQDEKNKIIRWFGTATDVTNQIEAEDLIKKDNELMENLLYIAAHDLKGPVANMQLALNLMNRLDSEGKLKLIGRFQDLADQLERIIKGVTHLLRIRNTDESSGGKIYFERALDAVKLEFKDKLSTFSIQSDFSEKKTIHFIESFLHSILKNLISNSIKYARDDVPPEIKVSTKRKGSYTLLCVRDNGIGIDLKKHEKKLFLPFQRLDAGKAEGTGIGLYLVKNIIEKNGGYIEAESMPGVGTIFNCYLKEY